MKFCKLQIDPNSHSGDQVIIVGWDYGVIFASNFHHVTVARHDIHGSHGAWASGSLGHCGEFFAFFFSVPFSSVTCGVIGGKAAREKFRFRAAELNVGAPATAL